MIIEKVRNKLLSKSRFNKQLLVAASDFTLLLFASFLALSISHGSSMLSASEQIFRLLWAPFFGVIFLTSLGTYRSIVRFIEFSVNNYSLISVV